MSGHRCAKCAEWEASFLDETSKLEHHAELLERKLAAQAAVIEAAKEAADKLFEAITLGDACDEERAAYRRLVDAVNAYCKAYCKECTT